MAVVVMGGVPRQPALVPTDTALAAGWWLWLLGGRRASKTRAQNIGGARIAARACDARGKTRALDALQEPPANMRPRRPLCPGLRVFACCWAPQPSMPVVRGLGTLKPSPRNPKPKP